MAVTVGVGARIARRPDPFGDVLERMEKVDTVVIDKTGRSRKESRGL